MRGHLVFLGVVCSSISAIAAEPPLVTAAREGENMLFAVTLPRPADMGGVLVEKNGYYARRAAGAPRVPELFATPAWSSPAYLEAAGLEWSELPDTLETLTFVGRCPRSDSASFTLRYPKQDDSWATADVSVDLQSAAAGDPMALGIRFNTARAGHCGLMSESASDLGGFWAYAERSFRRQKGLPERENFRGGGRGRDDFTERLYTLTTGALAVQESLQLDRMAAAVPASPAPRTVPFAKIKGVTVRSHPFDEMRKGREPADEPLARLVPEDNYYVRFTSTAKLIDGLDYAERWGTSLLRLASAKGTDFETRRRVMNQMCLPPDGLSRVLGPTIVREVVMTGSDPFLRMGSDITLIFNTADSQAFFAALEPFIPRDAESRGRREVEGWPVESVHDAARGVSLFRAAFMDVCVYSNSEEGLRRVIAAGMKRAPSLKDAPDFKYMRAAVFPYDAAKEDGFIFLSDAFIRRLTGPEVRIKQVRRLEAAASLGILNNARLLHGYTFGPGSPGVEELVKAGCLDTKDLFDPEGGSFTIDPATGAATSSTWSAGAFLKPLVEVPGDAATEAEAKDYDQFRRQYQQYWRRYFDPIGVRITVADTMKIETHILPLIDTSAYNQLKDLSAGEPLTVDLASFPGKTLVRFTARFGEGQLRQSAMTGLFSISGTNLASDWLGDWVTVWIEDSDALTTLVKHAYAQEAGEIDSEAMSFDLFNISLVAGVHCKNKVSLASFLVGMKSVIDSVAPNTVVFTPLEPHGGVTIVKISPDPRSEWAESLNRPGEEQGEEGARREAALYYATIGDGWYISTQDSALRNLIDAQARDAVAKRATDPRRANALVYASLAGAESSRSAAAAVLEAQARRESLANMTTLLTLGRCGALAGGDVDAATRRYLGCRLVSPDGGTYRYDGAGLEVASTVRGPLHDPRRFDAPPEGSPLASLLAELQRIVASLRFTEDGVETDVEIRRR